MKRFTSLLIGCSLALAGVAMAQQPNEEASPGKKKKEGAEQTQPAQAKPGPNAAKPHATAVREQGARNAPGAANEPGTGKGRKAHQESATAQGAENTVSGQPAASATPSGERHNKGMKEHAAKTSPAPAATAAAAASATPAVSTGTHQKGQANVGAQKGQANVGAGAKKKPEPQKVQQIKAQHANFRAQPKPQQVPAVTYNQNYRIQGSESWQGPQYEVFRAYRPERHDQGWYRSRYNRVELIGGGYYYWNNGYWYPAWGYDSSAEYYAYDAPIYVGHSAEPPDRVIADVQAELQEMGYYKGEVDGLLGPMTREALAAYQTEQGLVATAVIDEPTLDSLGMS
jgi:hypothetical protein